MTALDVPVSGVGISQPLASAARATSGRRLWTLVVLAGLVLLGAAAVASVAALDGDGGADTYVLVGRVAADLTRVGWAAAALVLAFTFAHYLATAVAARAASGIALPLREVFLVQLAAAAANRLTPAGLGGSAVTARYLTRRGLPAAGAVGCVTALAGFGVLADLIVLAALLGVGPLIGFSGGRSESRLLLHRVLSLIRPLNSVWFDIGCGVLILAAVAFAVSRRRRSAETLRRFWAPLRQLAQRPRALSTLMSASALTTLVLAGGFVASTHLIPGARPHVGALVLGVGYLLGAAVGNAVPTPAGVGSTEAALVAVLFTAGVPAAHAVEVVLVFRLLTFWLPAALGVLATRRLRRARAL
jgi:uncharacterized membrane protein YbhN (UPF0104 family)